MLLKEEQNFKQGLSLGIKLSFVGFIKITLITH